MLPCIYNHHAPMVVERIVIINFAKSNLNPPLEFVTNEKPPVKNCHVGFGKRNDNRMQ